MERRSCHDADFDSWGPEDEDDSDRWYWLRMGKKRVITSDKGERLANEFSGDAPLVTGGADG